jgi:hypothetical protein
LDASYSEGRTRAHLRNADHNLARVRRMAPTLLQQGAPCQAGIKAQRLPASTSDTFRANRGAFSRFDAIARR